MRRSGRCAAQRSSIPIAAIVGAEIGDANGAADRVCYQGYRVTKSDLDFLCYLDGIIDLDPEIPHRALDLGMPKEELDCTEIASAPVD